MERRRLRRKPDLWQNNVRINLASKHECNLPKVNERLPGIRLHRELVGWRAGGPGRDGKKKKQKHRKKTCCCASNQITT